MIFSLSAAGAALEATAPDMRTVSTMLEVLKDEVLDTVSFRKPVHFVSPDIADVLALSETYRVEAGEGNQLRLISPHATRRAVVVDALAINHAYEISTPIALYAQDDENFPHVVLLLPGGKGLEAVGSYDGIRSRGLDAQLLTARKIQEALDRKLRRTSLP
jgi:hypothetical protein